MMRVPLWLECFIDDVMVMCVCCRSCSLLPNGETDPTSLHGSCPTTKGEKWSATKWIHVGPFGGSAEQQRAKWCDLLPYRQHPLCMHGAV